MANGGYGPPLMPTWLAAVLMVVALLAFGMCANYGVARGWWPGHFTP